MWTKEDAIELCKQLEPIAAAHGAHVALTGGLLYKDGPRKDCDVLFYRHKPKESIRKKDLLATLSFGKMNVTKDYGRIVKAAYDGKVVDLFFPEDSQFGNYPE